MPQGVICLEHPITHEKKCWQLYYLIPWWRRWWDPDPRLGFWNRFVLAINVIFRPPPQSPWRNPDLLRAGAGVETLRDVSLLSAISEMSEMLSPSVRGRITPALDGATRQLSLPKGIATS